MSDFHPFSPVAQWWSGRLLTDRFLVRVQTGEPFRDAAKRRRLKSTAAFYFFVDVGVSIEEEI
jgi:hypothetical protein